MANILYITTQSQWCGSEPLWYESAEKALAEGHRVQVGILQGANLGHRIDNLRDMGAKIFFRPPAHKRRLWLRILWRLQGIRKPYLHWWTQNILETPDVICVSQGGSYCISNVPGLMPWLNASGIPFVLVCHSHRTQGVPAISYRPELNECFSKAAKVCFVAHDNLKAAERYLGLKLGNAVVVQNPVNLAEAKAESGNSEKLKAETLKTLNSRPSTLDAKAPEARMASVARFEVRDKGQDLLLEALADPVWRERDFRLDFFGSGPDREILEDLISFYGLGDKVRIVGFESDIRKIWREHGLLVLPSLSEGTPISLIEAQLCGRAALVTRVDGIPEWVEEGKTGFLAEAATVHHLRLALERAWENRHRWAEMGEAARAACLAKRDPDPAGTLLRLLKAAAEA